MSTIFALSSGALPSAIAIFRLSGPRSAAVLTRLTARKVFKPRVIFHSRILGEDGRQLDSAMAVFLPGPSTFTGEDTAEIFVHGGKAIADALSSTLSRIPGLRHAHAGEFTKRALLNGKLSTTEVAALGALLQAATPRQLAQANRALQEGDWLAERIQGLRGRVALVADFGEDVHTDVEDVRREMASLVAELREKRRRGEAAARVRNGLRAVLVGRPNVGKSSIFNRLARSERAIVSHVAGTTRDTIEVTVNVEGVPLTLTDTAGLRDSDDPVEEEGIRRTRNKMEDADVVVGVVSGEKATEEEADIRALLPEGKELIVVRNKADLVPPEVRAENPGVWTTATEPEGVAALERELEATVAALCPPDSELSLSAGMPEVERLLDEALTHTDIGLTAELLQEAAEAWGRAHSNDHVLSIIMRDFCIGK